MSLSEMTKILIEAAKKDGSYYASYLPKKEGQTTWVGLTDEEVRQICGSVPAMREVASEVEAKLKEKNT